MSERSSQQDNKKQVAYKFTRGALAVVGGVTLVGNATDRLVGPEPVETADAKITHNVSMNKPVSVLEGGKAVIDFGKGKRAIITNPLIEKDTVAERTTGKDAEKDLVTAYEADSDSNTTGSVEKITYEQGGREISNEQALAESSSERVNVDPATNQLVVSEGQQSAGQVVAQSVHQHQETQTIKTYVNDK